MRILIADDHAILRGGLRSLIESQSDAKVVGEADDAQTAVRLAKELSPDVVIMDMNMPDLNGVEAARQIHQHNPAIKVIVLSLHSDKHIVRESLKAGVSAYVLKDYVFDELPRALEIAGAGGHYLSPRIPVGLDGLTSTERQVLQLLTEDLTAKQIAKQLAVSPKTVDAWRRNIMNKLGVSSVAELVKCAIRAGLTSVDR